MINLERIKYILDNDKNIPFQNFEKEYLKLMIEILTEANSKESGREKMPTTFSLFGKMLKIDLKNEGFPLLYTKKLSFKNILAELLWFLNGETHVKALMDVNCNIWNEDSYNYYVKVFKSFDKSVLPFEDYVSFVKNNDLETLSRYTKLTLGNSVTRYIIGDCGEQYGKLWRGKQLRGFITDQITTLIHNIRNNPFSRRHLVTAWNPDTINVMALPACHNFFQIYCSTDNELDLQFYMRSSDLLLGLPYNIASYALLLQIIAHLTDKKVRNLIVVLGDVHIYSNQIDSCYEQLKRVEKENFDTYKKPSVKIENISFRNLLLRKDFTINEILENKHFQLENYTSLDVIKGKLNTGI
jgi:thymidylate synthase